MPSFAAVHFRSIPSGIGARTGATTTFLNEAACNEAQLPKCLELRIKVVGVTDHGGIASVAMAISLVTAMGVEADFETGSAIPDDLMKDEAADSRLRDKAAAALADTHRGFIVNGRPQWMHVPIFHRGAATTKLSRHYLPGRDNGLGNLRNI